MSRRRRPTSRRPVIYRLIGFFAGAAGKVVITVREKRSSRASVLRSARELLLPGLDGEGELVLGRRQRAGGEGGEGAGRVVGGVEVHYHRAVLDRTGVEEAAG